MYFETSIRRIDKDKDKEVTEKFIVSRAMLFFEVEATMLTEYSNECNVIAIKQSKIKDIVNSRTSEDDDIYYATLESFYMSESGEEKSSKNDVALFAKDMTDAKAKLDSYMKQGLSDMAIVKIVQTKFLDVIPCSIGANGEN